MSFANETRLRVGYVLLGTGLGLIFISHLSSSSWADFALVFGIGLFGGGAYVAIPVALINVVSWFPGYISRVAEPVWDGEILHTDGGADKVRYSFDEDGNPWFVASDICIAIGNKPPIKGDMKWGGIQLTMYGENACLSEENVQAFLTPLAMKHYDANRLLNLIRNSVLRKIEKKRHDKKLYG